MESRIKERVSIKLIMLEPSSLNWFQRVTKLQHSVNPTLIYNQIRLTFRPCSLQNSETYTIQLDQKLTRLLHCFCIAREHVGHK
jgi:hypothetical protein